MSVLKRRQQRKMREKHILGQNSFQILRQLRVLVKFAEIHPGFWTKSDRHPPALLQFGAGDPRADPEAAGARERLGASY
jgi:hypothetical protein